jgi:hypothetical protein
MLPFDHRPWAKHLAATVILITLVAAVLIPIYLHRHHILDTGAIVAVLLILLAAIPPNIAILMHKCTPEEEARRAARSERGVLASRAVR